jgi:hypothetical protein
MSSSFMARVFMLGAGASCFAGYPLGAELWKFIRQGAWPEVMAQQRAAIVIPAIDALIAESGGDDKQDLEKLFTQKDLDEKGRGDWSDVKEKLMAMIADAFLFHEFDLHEKLADAQSVEAEVLRKWTTFLGDGDTVITFNWDIFHEAALWRSRKWHYADGYGFVCSDAPTGFTPSRIKVLKLHGSVNWAQEDKRDCKPSIEHKQTFFSGALDADDTYLKGTLQWNGGRNLIVPSYLKDLTQVPLLVHIWNQAADALAEATKVFTIGYSLQPADAQARLLIASALLRNKNDFPIQIVSPGQDNWNEFCRSIGRPKDRISMKFEEWIINV